MSVHLRAAITGVLTATGALAQTAHTFDSTSFAKGLVSAFPEEQTREIVPKGEAAIR